MQERMARHVRSRQLSHFPLPRMTEREFHDALRLLDTATALLHDRTEETIGHPEVLQRIRELMLQFDLLRLRLAQAPVDLQRN